MVVQDQHVNNDNAWEQWDWLWKGMFTISLLASVALVLSNSELVSRWEIYLFSLILFLWHSIGLYVIERPDEYWEERALRRFIIILGDLALWFILINFSIVFYVALFGLFSQIFRYLPRGLATIATSLFALGTIFEQLNSDSFAWELSSPALWLFVLMSFGSLLIGTWMSAIISQSTQRRDLIERLEQTQSALADAKFQAGILEERQRLAREIHDTLAQGLISIIMQLESAKQSLANKDLQLIRQKMETAEQLARHNLNEARRVVQDLTPEILDGKSLAQAMERTISRWQQRTDIPATLQTTGTILALHPTIEVTLLRALQEALSNIYKHAQSNSVSATLSYMPDAIILDIVDDGIGFQIEQDLDNTKQGGFGLVAMRQRVENCHGVLTIESDSDGTTLTINIPVKA